MTNQEAIKWLSPDTSPAMVHRAEECEENPMDYINRAIELAIEALNSPIQMSGTSDLISRQAAQTVLAKLRTDDVNELDAVTIQHCIGQLGILPSAGCADWIPCSERLPDESEWAASYIRSKYSAEFIVMLQGANRPTTLYLTKDGKWFDDSYEFYKNVISWMPLPEPYKPEED